jgi:hypothetical protein
MVSQEERKRDREVTLSSDPTPLPLLHQREEEIIMRETWECPHVDIRDHADHRGRHNSYSSSPPLITSNRANSWQEGLARRQRDSKQNCLIFLLSSFLLLLDDHMIREEGHR